MRNRFEAEVSAYHHYWRSRHRAETTFAKYAEHLRKWHATTGSLAPTLHDSRRYLISLEESEGRWSAYWATRALKSFAAFLADESEEPNALAKLKIPEMGKPTRTPTARPEDTQRILDSLTGSDVWSRRDHAIICVLRSGGLRRSEVARMRFDHVDLATGRVLVPEAKGDHPRVVRISDEAVRSLRRYLRALDAFEDRRRRDGEHSELWISHRSTPLTSNGIQKMLAKRGRAVGLNLPAHAFRRGFAVEFLSNGGSETYLMKLAGWRHRDMVARYTAAVAEEEALKQHQQIFG